MKGFIPFLLLLAIFSTATQADIYKWIDDDGKAHFSDTNPVTAMPEEKIQAIEIPPVNIIEKNNREQEYTKNFLKEKDKERASENAKRAREKYTKKPVEKKEPEVKPKQQKHKTIKSKPSKASRTKKPVA